MENVDRKFLFLSAIYGLLGMLIGLYMAAIETFKFSAVHTHLTLFGFVSMAIYGLAYRAGLAKNDQFAAAHFWVSAVGAIVFPLGEGLALTQHGIVVAGIGSMLVILSGFQFLVAVYRAR
jgi:lysylphosphatidylglycerol synthetase-like protein (DUF2156 family)